MPQRCVRSAARKWRQVDSATGRSSTVKERSRWSERITTVPPAVGAFFPLDQRLRLTKHSWSPGTIAQAVRNGLEIASYRRAAEQFVDLTHVSLSKSSLQRLVNEYGEQLVAMQAAEATAMVQVASQETEVAWRQVPAPASDCMNISMDGALIHIRDEGWKEVKVATISAVTHCVDDQDGSWTTHLCHHSYRAGLWEAATFSRQQWAEACRRGVEKATYLSSVNDGAAWIWNITRMCYGRCVEILDWWHAVERLWTIAHLHLGTASDEAAAWVTVQKQRLSQSRLRDVFAAVRRLYPRSVPLPDAVRQAVVYLFHNRWRMRYREFRQAGYPIGSGSVESACKVVAQQRLKQAGMRWSRMGAQAILALRAQLLSHRWPQTCRSLGLA